MTTPTDTQTQRAKWDLLLLDIEHRTEQLRQIRRWEAWKTVAALIAALAVFGGGVATVATWWHPAPQTINVKIEGGLPR